jgi:Flp pilus assembly protein TadB
VTTALDTVEFFRTLEHAMRAGFSLRQGIERASHDFESERLQEVSRAAAAGAPITTLFDEWSTSEPDIGLLAGAIRLQTETRGNLADTLGVLHAVIERRPRAPIH